jgi:hypothetical protein
LLQAKIEIDDQAIGEEKEKVWYGIGCLSGRAAWVSQGEIERRRENGTMREKSSFWQKHVLLVESHETTG